MNRLVKLTPLILILALLISSIQPASALWYAGASFQDTVTTGGKLTGEDPSSESGVYSARDESIYLVAQGYVVGVYAYFKIYGREDYVDANIGCRIEYLTSNATLNSKPNGTIVDTANMTVNTSLMNNDTYTLFYFTFDGDVWIADESKLALIFYVESATMINDNNCPMWGSHAAGGYAGYCSSYVNGAWGTLYATGDYYFILALSDTGGTEPTPTPSPTATPTSDSSETNELIDTFTDYLIPLILFLLPAIILGWLTHWEKWPILIGLAIGAGLTYLFMGTEYLWLVILVIIGIGASAYQSSRGN